MARKKYIVRNTLSITDMMFANQGTTPDNPEANNILLYAKTDGNFYKLDENGVEEVLGGGQSRDPSVLNLLTLANQSTNYTIPTATLDAYDGVKIDQTTAGILISLGTPSNITKKFDIISGSGATVSFNIQSTTYTLATGGSAYAVYDGTGWKVNVRVTQSDVYDYTKLIVLPGSNMMASTNDTFKTLTLHATGNFVSNVSTSTQYAPIIFADTAGKTGTSFDITSAAIKRSYYRASDLIGSFTTTQRDSITGWNTNEIIYNTTLNRLEYYNGTTWLSRDGDVGGIFALSNTTSDNKFLLADGSAISRTTYSEYFAKINPNIATTYSCTFTSGNTTITSAATLVVGDGYRLRFTTTTGGVTVGTTYFVKVLTSTTFAIATTFANLRAGTYFSPTGSGANTFTQSPYGFGDGSTTFNLPDLRGTFLRGLDITATYDLDGTLRQIGNIQFDQFKSHNHKVRVNTATDWPGGWVPNDNVSYVINGTDRGTTNALRGGVANGHMESIGGNQTNPLNTSVYYYIKVL